jgi:hypothetical protein
MSGGAGGGEKDAAGGSGLSTAALRARLVSPEAREAWRASVHAGWTALMAAPLRELVDATAIERVLSSVLSDDALERGVRPLLSLALEHANRELAGDRNRWGDYLSDEALQALDALMGSPGVVPDRLVREALAHEAARAAVRDVLFDALKEFNDTVNPFFADWGLPALLKKLGPFGLGGMSKAFDSMRAEFDRRLEPEIRKFLHGFSRRANDRLTDIVIGKIDTPPFVALRKQLAQRLLDERMNDLVQPVDDARARLARAFAIEAAVAVLSREVTRLRLARVLELCLNQAGARPLGEVLASIGVRWTPDLDAVADALWPLVATAGSTEQVTEWLASLAAPSATNP